MARATHHETPQHESQNGQQIRGMMQPDAILESYGRLMQQMENINRMWFGSVRQTAEAGWDFVSQVTETAIADGRRVSDMYCKLYQADLSAATSALRTMGQETTSRHLSAVQRAAQAAE